MHRGPHPLGPRGLRLQECAALSRGLQAALDRGELLAGWPDVPWAEGDRERSLEGRHRAFAAQISRELGVAPSPETVTFARELLGDAEGGKGQPPPPDRSGARASR